MTPNDRTQSHAFSSGRFPRVLLFWDGGQTSRDLVPGACLRVGRGEDCDIVVPIASVSRAHLELVVGDSSVVLRDLGSSNGIRVGGRVLTRHEETPLVPGVLVELGQATLVVSGVSAGASSGDGMEAVHRLIDLVAPTQLNVLLLGETGVGKEIATQAIHQKSKRTGSLVRVNCAALAESLLESELFGHERGAFTGAVGTRVGLVEHAKQGTLFLDEIGEMPLTTQAKLLRVIEQREVRRVGGVNPIAVDVRFVAATHRDLESLSETGEFRRDLYFRLNGISISIPPLRERRAEILPLAREFVKTSSNPSAVLTPAAIAVLESYPWPGNVRELRNVIERAVVLSRGHILPEHLRLTTRPELPAAKNAQLPGDDERERIRVALEEAGGNQGRAAEILGISRRTLVSRLSQYGFPRPRRK